MLTASMLRHDLAIRARSLASRDKLLHDLTPGGAPSVIFGLDEQGRHGNFHPDSFAALAANPDWARRRNKVHTAWKRWRARADWPWSELDCASSSDALLMNVFCHPATLASPGIRALLGIDHAAAPHFGFRPGIPFTTGRLDRTEIDLKLGTLFLEAKLTESSFQQARLGLIERYRDLHEVFEVAELPLAAPGKVRHYQLIRGALAAHAHEASFCVLSDARRADLIDAWYTILRAVHRSDLKPRLQMLTWQELAAHLHPSLQHFLAAKYGILAP